MTVNVKINVKLAGVRNEDGTEYFYTLLCRLHSSPQPTSRSGLDKLACNLDYDQCKHLREFYKEDEVFRIMRRKGVYPYKYMNAWGKFMKTSLPPKDAFYNRLNMKSTSEQDHEHAQQVWNIREKKTLGCYHDTCLKTDFLLLADVFETFWNTCLKIYKLDTAHFYTTPGLALQT